MLMRAASQIQTALDGLAKLPNDPRDDPVLADSEAQRKKLWTKWAVCFQLDDVAVYTIHRAATDLSDFSQAVGLVVGPLGTDSGQARKLVATILAGGRSILGDAAEVATRLRADSAEGSPRAELASRLDSLTRATWRGLLEEVAQSVNRRWSDVRTALAGVSSLEALQAAFAPDGPFGTFRKDCLEDFFEGENLLPRKTILDARLELAAGLRQAILQEAALASDLFDPSGAIRSDRMVLDLQLGGSAAQSLVVQYQPKEGRAEVSPRSINASPVTFEFTWDPTTCLEFRFTVGLGAGSDPVTHRWTGPWAVAQAFHSARHEGNRYIWPKTPGDWKNAAGEPYEVWLLLLPRSDRRLLDFYPGGNVGSPVQALMDALPAKAVVVQVDH